MKKASLFLLFYIFIFPAVLLRKYFYGSENIWVIGGHSGRAYEDNSAALHQYIANKTNQEIIWITGNQDVFSKLQAQNNRVYWKNSVKARVSIVMASVLIRSHGYNDLDNYFGRWRFLKPSGLMIHLNHCMKHLKAGQMHSPVIGQLSAYQRRKLERKIVDFDHLLACSPLEKKNFCLSMPSKTSRIVLGGGAHLDGLSEQDSTEPDPKIILYFPTWREKEIKSPKSLIEIVDEIVKDESLATWLSNSNYKLSICTHINTKKSIRSADWPEMFEHILPDHLQEYLPKCSVLISDYSGVILDALFLDKPVVFFAHDLDAYLSYRHLFVDYENFAFGPIVKSSQELVSQLLSNEWNNPDLFRDIRAEHFQEIFPYGTSGYAERSYCAIRHLLAGGDPAEID